ncbi:hypothetical protein [Rhodococcus triatomae]|uniref:nSTAND1 domain-containing NTPase n=1 Tax=Rhodococcus triatomae TaxID=300028 RepID=UPI001FED0ADB|nr:hypothetical protein [Rhodococcus triatomae]
MPARFDGLAATLRVLVGAARARHPEPPVEGLYSVRNWQQLWEQAGRSDAAGTRGGEAPRPVVSTEPPYRGLAAFTADDSRFFFGRNRATAALLALVLANSDGVALTVLVGASGSGKSSLLHAGLAPALAPDRTAVEMTPGRDPGEGLDAALESAPRGSRVVLIVDQFEELFTQTTDERRRTRFVDRLIELARDRRGGSATVDAVVVAVRADFYEQCLRYPELAERLEYGQMVLGPMTQEEIASAVDGPAELVGVGVEPGLVDVMLRDLGAGTDGNEESAPGRYNAGALPLLGHALLATWQERTGDRLSIAAYKSVGGVRGAVARTAEEVWSKLTAPQQFAARQLLMELVTVAEDGPDTRRRVSRPRLLGACADPAAAAAALQRLTDARLVTGDATGVELTHEAVFEAWPRLAGWLSEDRADAVLRQRIDKDAHEWEAHDRDGSLLYRGLRLESALTWAEGRGERVGSTTAAFIEAGRRQDRSARVRRRVLVAALTVLALVASVAAVTAQVQRLAADDERNAAQFAEVLAQAARTQNSDPSLSAQLSLVARDTRPEDDTAFTMTVATQNSPLASPLSGHDGAVYHTAVGPNGIAASASYDRTIRLWNVDGPRAQVGPPLVGHTSWVTSVAFSPDGALLASGSGDHTVRLWDVRDPEHPRPIGGPLEGHDGAIYMVAFSPDGRTVASAGDDGTVRLWNVEDPEAVVDRSPPLRGHTAAVRSVAFSPDGRTLVSGSDDLTARLWNLSDPAAPEPWGPPLVGHSDTVHSVAFSPDGSLLATGSDDQSVRLWFVDDMRTPVPARESLTGHDAAIWSIGFSPDGSALVSASWDGTARIWSLKDPNRPTVLGQPLAGSSGGLTTAVFTRDGHTVVTGGQDGVVRMWTLSDAVLAGHTLRVATPAVSADGRVMATGSRDGTALVWDVADGHTPVARARVTPPDGLGIEAIAMSADGTLLASASLGTGRIQLWDIDRPDPVPAGPPLEVAARYTHGLAFSPDGSLLATAAGDQSVQLWQLHRHGPPTAVAPPLTGAAGWINAVQFSPDGSVLAAASSDKTVHLWDVSEPSAPRTAGPPLVGHDGAVNTVAFSADGQVLASGSDDQTIRVWEWQEGSRAEAAVLTGHSSTIRSVSFAPDGRMLASGSDDQSVRLWNVDDPEQAHAVGGSVVPDGTVRWRVVYGASPDVLLAAGEGGAVRALDLDVEHSRERVCAATGGILTREIWPQYLTDLRYRSPCA